MNRREYENARDLFLEKMVAYSGVGDETRWDFEDELMDKLEDGYSTYGDSSYSLPVLKLLDEVTEEMIDIPGWLTIAFGRAEELGHSRNSLYQMLNIAGQAIDMYGKINRLKKLIELEEEDGRQGLLPKL